MADSATSRSGSPAATRFKARPRLMLGQLGPAAEPRALGHGADADDPQIGFRELQRELHPDLTKEQWLNLFALWREHDNERLRTELAARRARVAELEDARRAAFITRTLMPPQGDDELERVAAQMKPELFRHVSVRDRVASHGAPRRGVAPSIIAWARGALHEAQQAPFRRFGRQHAEPPQHGEPDTRGWHE